MDVRGILAVASLMVLLQYGAPGVCSNIKSSLVYNCTQPQPVCACQPCAQCPPCVVRPCLLCPDTKCPVCPPQKCPSCTIPQPPTCKIPWRLLSQYRSHPGIGIYRIYTQRVSWKEAKQICEKDGTHLAIINSQAEANLFKTFYRDAGIKDWFFLGFNRGKDGKFYTVKGQPLQSTGYVKWGTNEPNNANNSEHCGFMLASGLLADGWCDAKLTFVCEAPL